MNVEVKANKLIITLDLNEKGTPSGSGKTMVHASTHGNTPTTVQIGGKVLILGVNAYTKAA